MSLARVKTWIFGERLNSADLNNEFNNILNNPVSLISPSTGAINFAAQAHTGIIPSAVTTTSGSGFQSVVGSTSGAGFLANMVGSAVKGLRGTVSSQVGTFNADQYVFQSTSGHGGFVLNSTSDFVVNLGTAGPVANGRDVAAVFASTYVHWYAISTGPNSAALAGIVSSNAPPTGPVMPTGYPLWTYLGGSVYTSASTTVLSDHVFRGNWVYYATQLSLLTNGQASTEATVTFSTAAPTNAEAVSLVIVQAANTSTATQQNIASIRHTTGQTFASPTMSVTAGDAASDSSTLILPNVDNRFLYLQQSTANTPGLTIALNGYRVPNGG